jgi:hypothetical protein
LDTYDAGCDFSNRYPFPPYSGPIPFKNVVCGPDLVSICGTYGVFRDVFGERVIDHDWYRVSLDHASPIQATVTGDLATILRVFSSGDPQNTCGDLALLCPPDTASPCAEAICTARVPAGTYLIAVSPHFYADPGCGWNYTLTLSCSDGITTTRRTSWGKLKSLYR